MKYLIYQGKKKKKKRVQCYSLTHDYQSQFFCMI